MPVLEITWIINLFKCELFVINFKSLFPLLFKLSIDNQNLKPYFRDYKPTLFKKIEKSYGNLRLKVLFNIKFLIKKY